MGHGYKFRKMVIQKDRSLVDDPFLLKTVDSEHHTCVKMQVNTCIIRRRLK